MDTISSRTLLTYQQERDRVAALQSLPTFVDKAFLQDYVLPGTLFFTVLLTVVFCLSVIGTRHASPQKSKDTVYYIAYKITHLVGNTMIGVMGYYYCFKTQMHPTQDVTTVVSVEAIVTGFKDVTYPMACIQLGKNLWAIPAGYFLGDEAAIMILHHLSVILVAIASCSFTMGFQYYVPLVFGMFELSSIPLAVVEVFKDNPHYQKEYPTSYVLARIAFMVSFLYIRWFLFLPYFWDFLRLSGFAITSFPSNTPRALFSAISIAWCACWFLGALQIYWGYVILRGFAKVIIGGSSSGKKEDATTTTGSNGNGATATTTTATSKKQM